MEEAVAHFEFDRVSRAARPQSGRVIASLAAVGLVVAILASVAGDNVPVPQAADPQACLAINEGAARLACYDSALHRSPTEPARGATAPIR